MGKIGSKPYVIDDFDSNDETDCNKTTAEVCRGYALAQQEKEIPAVPEPVIQEVAPTPTPKEPVPAGRMRETKIGLKKLVKLLEKNDFEEAKKAANFLIENQVLSVTNTATDNEEVFLIESAKSLSMSTGTSSWSSKSPAWVTVTSDCTLSQLTTESSHSTAWQQETVTHVLKDDNDEKKIVTNALVQNSEIPQLLSSVWRYQKKSIAHKSRKTPRASSPHMAAGGSKSSDSPKHTASASGRSSDQEKLKNGISRSHETGARTPTRVRASPSHGHSKKSHSFLTFSNNIDIHNRWAHRPIVTVKSSTKARPGSNLKTLRTKFDVHKVQRKPKRRSSSSSKSVETQSVASTINELDEQKVLDFRRWYCIARPQYRTSSGVTSVVSCWNFLFSTMGYGSLQPITQDAALMLLGFAPPFDEINFAVLADNSTLFRWFSKLNSHFGVSGYCSYLYKPFGKNRTKDVTSGKALSELREGLKDTKTAFIYHCYKHYFCPIGYEETLGSKIESPMNNDSARGDSRDAVGDMPDGNAGEKSGGENKETWILIGDTCRNHPSIHCVSWTEVCLDLECKSPNFFDIRHSWKGIRQAGIRSDEHDSCHCILTFQKSAENLTQLLNTVPSVTTHSSSPLSLPQQDPAPSPALPRNSQTIRGCASVDILKPLGKSSKSFTKVKKEKVRSRSKSPFQGVPLAHSAHPSFMRVKSASPPKEKRKLRAKSVCKEYRRQHSPNTEITRNHFTEGDNYDFLIFDEQKNIGS